MRLGRESHQAEVIRHLPYTLHAYAKAGIAVKLRKQSKKPTDAK